MLLKISTGKISSKHSFREGATMKELQDKVTEVTGLSLHEIDVFHGYPLKKLTFSNPSSTVESQGVENGSVITVRSNPNLKELYQSLVNMGFKHDVILKVMIELEAKDKDIAIDFCQQISQLDVDDGSASVTRKAIPADNSCLFNSIGFLLRGSFNPIYYRTLVAEAIKKDPNTFTSDYLDMDPVEYVRWIQNPEKWGGEIEISILSDALGVEISVADIRSSTILTYGEGKGFQQRVYLLYDGIHYDAIVQEKKVGAQAPVETCTFTPDNQAVYAAVLSFVSELKRKKQFVNLSSGQLYCNICYQTFVGEKEAVSHAKQTGHQNFGQSA